MEKPVDPRWHFLKGRGFSNHTSDGSHLFKKNRSLFFPHVSLFKKEKKMPFDLYTEKREFWFSRGKSKINKNGNGEYLNSDIGYLFRSLLRNSFDSASVFSFYYEKASAGSNPFLTDLSYDNTTSIFSDFQPEKRKLSYSKIWVYYSRRLLSGGFEI